MKKLFIVADYNDGDYVKDIVKVEDSVFEKFLLLLGQSIILNLMFVVVIMVVFVNITGLVRGKTLEKRISMKLILNSLLNILMSSLIFSQVVYVRPMMTVTAIQLLRSAMLSLMKNMLIGNKTGELVKKI